MCKRLTSHNAICRQLHYYAICNCQARIVIPSAEELRLALAQDIFSCHNAHDDVQHFQIELLDDCQVWLFTCEKRTKLHENQYSFKYFRARKLVKNRGEGKKKTYFPCLISNTDLCALVTKLEQAVSHPLFPAPPTCPIASHLLLQSGTTRTTTVPEILASKCTLTIVTCFCQLMQSF